MNTNNNYLIQIVDHNDNSQKIINHITNLNSYVDDFNIIMNHLNKDNEYSLTLLNEKAVISKSEQIIIPGYLFNTTKNTTKIVYTLNLIEIDLTLSNLFLTLEDHKNNCTSFLKLCNENNSNKINTETQTDSEQQTEELQDEYDTQYYRALEDGYDTECDTEYDNEYDTESDSDNEPFIKYLRSNSLEDMYNNTDFYGDDETKPFGEFQYSSANYICDYDECFSHADIIKEYEPSYNSLNNPLNKSSYNPFHRITTNSNNNIIPQQNRTTWNPELITELKFRLTQPNAGLSPINYFL